MKKAILIALLFVFLSEIVTAGENNLTGSVFAPSVYDYLDLSSSANPDLPCFQIHFAGFKANAMFGGEIGALGIFSDDFKYVLTLPAFLNLYDYTQSFIPYMLWRGSFGLNNYFEFPGLMAAKDNRLIFKIGIIHESDHYTGSEGHGYWADYNINFSHMNYFNLGIIFVNNISGKDNVLLVSFGYKYNFNNLLILSSSALSARNPVHSYYGESCFTLKVDENIDMYLSIYAEKMVNSPPGNHLLHPGIMTAAESDYLYLNLGAKFKGVSGTNYQPYLIYSSSNGRGVDYLFRDSSFGCGLRVAI